MAGPPDRRRHPDPAGRGGRRSWTGTSPPVAHQIGLTALDRLIDEALTRFDPEAAEQRAAEALEHRGVDVHLHQVAYDGTVDITGVWTCPTRSTSKTP